MADKYTQRATGGPAAPEYARDLAALCGCGHDRAMHEIGTRSGREIRTWCTVQTGEGHCRCLMFCAWADESSRPVTGRIDRDRRVYRAIFLRRGGEPEIIPANAAAQQRRPPHHDQAFFHLHLRAAHLPLHHCRFSFGG